MQGTLLALKTPGRGEPGNAARIPKGLCTVPRDCGEREGDLWEIPEIPQRGDLSVLGMAAELCATWVVAEGTGTTRGDLAGPGAEADAETGLAETRRGPREGRAPPLHTSTTAAACGAAMRVCRTGPLGWLDITSDSRGRYKR